MKVGWLAWCTLALAGCGRLGFEPMLTANLVVGSSIADLEVCGGPARYLVTDTPLAPGWTADHLDTHEARIVKHRGQISGSSCIVQPLVIGPEQIQIYAYAMTDDGQQIELEATMAPTWTRERTTGGVDLWVHRPEIYHRDSGTPLPVLVFLHGWGHSAGVADSKNYNLESMPRDSGFLELFGQDRAGENPPRVPSLLDLPFLVLAPNCVEYGMIGGTTVRCMGWPSVDLYYDEVMAYARARYLVNEGRIYATGLSTGGEGSFRLASTRGNELTAVVPIASTYAESAWFTANMCNSKDVAIWAFHSTRDSGPTDESNSRNLTDLANACDRATPAQLDLGDWQHDNQGHSGWPAVYGETHGKQNGMFTSIYEWLHWQSR